VTLSLHKADPDTAVSIQVDNDRESVKGKVREVLDAYNETVEFIRARDTYNTADQTRGVLYAEGTTRSLVQRIAGIATAGVEGLPEEMRSLSQLGVKTDRDGTLSLDESVLDQALQSDPDKVMNVFLQGSGSGGVAEQLYQVAHQATRAGDGLLTRRQDGFASVTRDLDRRIEAQERMLERYEVRLRAEFAALESLITSLQGNVAHLPTEILS
jgi:flagellar hook-associated protein 2